MMDTAQTNPVAIVTGGESGIGRACAIALGKSGTAIALTYFRDAKAAETVVGEIAATGGRAIAVQADVGREDAVEALFAQTEAAFGTVTRLVNSAGLNMSGTMIGDMTLDQFDRVVRSDLYGPFLTCRRFVRGLGASGTGRIVNISSIHERAPRAGGVDYDSAKGGLAQLTATLALELAPQRIAVNGVAPGMILTPMNQSAIDDAAELARKEAAIPWGRAGTADEVATLVQFLLSDAADYITGTTVTIDGALSLTVAQGA
ncbi:SDR family NAD(P)-dependent oxidoreductase [Sphingomonas floccifaciens]|uniref:SDR family NAD(P)-dependent oxidoreductase n=1 Tax=Sphingomonas floccifaciens TaxID=1844115 RepID=A0ABW4NGH0_9SPHN